jgi:hypothetical protein
MPVIDYSQAIYHGYSRLRQFARHSLGRILGTVAATDRRYKFFLDLAETKLFLRAEYNALTRLLLEKGVMTEQEFAKVLSEELETAVKDQRVKWPEVKPSATGDSFVLDRDGFVKRCKEEEWPP